MIIQLNPTIPMYVIGKGNGYAIALMDYSQEHDILWVVAMNETGEIWTVPNPNVRLLRNFSVGREYDL